MRKKWTKEEIDYLTNNFKTATRQELESNLSRDLRTITLKANKLGLQRRAITFENKEQFASDFNNKSLKEVCDKYKLTIRQVQRRADKLGLKKRALTDFGTIEEFTNNFLSKTKQELEELYKTKYVNISSKASNIGLKRPKHLHSVPDKWKPIVSKEKLYDLYITQNYTVTHISKLLLGEDKRSSTIRLLLKKYGIVKDKQVVALQSYHTKLEKYGGKLGSKFDADKPLQDWLFTLGYVFKPNRDILDGKEIDLYNEELKIGIEYCGLYWHNEMSPTPRGRTYHFNKYKLAKSKGIRLITIFEDEWIHHEDQVKGFLLSILNLNTQRIYARNCDIKAISMHDAFNFYEKYHIQGKPRSHLYSSGLMLNDDIVGVMTIGNHHRYTDQIVLNRLCFKKDVTVLGGASRLLKNCLDQYDQLILTTWSDNRWSDGGVYEKLGFSLAKEISPDYSYVNLKKPFERIPKQAQRKSVTGCPDNIKEWEFALDKGLVRIWDCGKKKWTLKK